MGAIMSERTDRLINIRVRLQAAARADAHARETAAAARAALKTTALEALDAGLGPTEVTAIADVAPKIGRASCRERV